MGMQQTTGKLVFWSFAMIDSDNEDLIVY